MLILEIIFPILSLLIAVAFYTDWKKINSFYTTRTGPIVVGFFGLLQPLVDGLKAIFKEQIKLLRYLFYFFILAPFFICFFIILLLNFIDFSYPITCLMEDFRMSNSAFIAICFFLNFVSLYLNHRAFKNSISHFHEIKVFLSNNTSLLLSYESFLVYGWLGKIAFKNLFLFRFFFFRRSCKSAKKSNFFKNISFAFGLCVKVFEGFPILSVLSLFLSFLFFVLSLRERSRNNVILNNELLKGVS